MPSACLDHLVIAATSLAQGVEYIRARLGVKPHAGGQHAYQGTHNKLLKLDHGRYLEVIAIDPDGSNPTHPRWFDLDAADMKKKLLERPRLITWVARTDDIQSLVKSCKIDIGQVRPMSRGPLNWQMTIIADGSLAFSGQVPPLIAWDTDQHPADSLAESGCRLVKLEGFHPRPALLQDAIKSLGLEDELSIKPAESGGEKLTAQIETPAGIVVLD